MNQPFQTIFWRNFFSNFFPENFVIFSFKPSFQKIFLQKPPLLNFLQLKENIFCF